MKVCVKPSSLANFIKFKQVDLTTVVSGPFLARPFEKFHCRDKNVDTCGPLTNRKIVRVVQLVDNDTEMKHHPRLPMLLLVLLLRCTFHVLLKKTMLKKHFNACSA